MKSNKNLGFTVAEVLIAIGVVGLLTLLLVSVFRSNNSAAWQKSKDYKLGIVKYDKVYNAINYSFNQQLMKNNNVSNLGNILNNALNTLNTTCTGVSCAASVSGNKGGYDTKLSDLSRKLADNSELTVYSKSTGGATEYAVFVDTNGKEKPNAIGKDILPIYIDKDGNVINVNPKTGKKFEKVIQKKYDSNKKFTFRCPNENTVLTLAKNPKTGIYTDIHGRKCNKICKVDYAQKVYGHNLGNVNPISYDEANKLLIYDGDSYLKYFATYAPLTCFSNPDHSCKQAGALYYFKEQMKSLYGSEGAAHTVDEANKIVTAYESANKYVEYKASYNKDCTPVFDPNYPKCTNAGIKAYFNSAFGTSLNPTINTNNRTVSATSSDGYHIYSAKYDYASCAISNTSTKGCSPTEALQAFKDGLKGMGVTPGTISASTSGNSYTLTFVKDKNATYSATYTLGTSVNSCSATIVADIKSCDNGGTAISDLQGLKDIANNLSGKYCLTDDINIGSGWTPISGWFKGELDGQSHTLSGLSSTTGGVFASTSGAKIKNLNISGFNVNTTKTNVGALVGNGYNSKFENISITGSTVKGNDKVGGLVGYNTSSDINAYYIKNCHITSSTITASDYGGGLIGDMEKITVEKCYSKNMTVNTSDWGSGGLIGRTLNSIVNTSFSIGSDVKGVRATGGFIGCACCSLIYNSYTTNTISNCICHSSGSKYDASGGFVGQFSGYITNCYSAGSISGNCIGGFVGVFHDGHFGGSPATQAGSPVKKPTIGNSISTTTLYASGNKKGVFVYSSEHCGEGTKYDRVIKNDNQYNKSYYDFSKLNTNDGGIWGAGYQWNSTNSYHPTLKNNPE